MNEITVQLGCNSKLVYTRYMSGYFTVELEYVEEQGDPWYGAPIVAVDIDKEKALEIVGFLTKAFKL